MNPRTPCVALALSLVLAAAAPADAQRAQRPIAESRVSSSDGMMRVVPVAGNLELGIGRFSVQEIARPRTHVESDRNPTDIRLREGRIAGVGLRIRF